MKIDWPPMLTAVHPLGSDPLEVVDLDGDWNAGERSLGLSSGEPRITVATARRPTTSFPPVDLLLCAEPDPPAPWVSVGSDLDLAVEELSRVIAARPGASIVLAQLLRGDDGLAISDGLVAESLAYAALQSGVEHGRFLADRKPRSAGPEPGPAVLARRDGNRLVLTLNRPRVRNAVDVAMRDALSEYLWLVAVDDSIELVVIEGCGPSFSSGGDLGEFGTKPDPLSGHLIRCERSLPLQMAEVSRRLEFRMHGHSVGAGVELAAFAGRVVARHDAHFSLPELDFGLIPGSGGTVSIRRRVGPQRLAWLALSGRSIDAQTACRWGLVDEIVAGSENVNRGQIGLNKKGRLGGR
jgi:enoyl-CoA hydratase/carnithine racemase